MCAWKKQLVHNKVHWFEFFYKSVAYVHEILPEVHRLGVLSFRVLVFQECVIRNHLYFNKPISTRGSPPCIKRLFHTKVSWICFSLPFTIEIIDCTNSRKSIKKNWKCCDSIKKNFQLVGSCFISTIVPHKKYDSGNVISLWFFIWNTLESWFLLPENENI